MNLCADIPVSKQIRKVLQNTAATDSKTAVTSRAHLLQALDSEKEKFDREMLVHGKELSEAEFNTLMKQHKANVQDLENNFETEKERQRKALEKKVR